MPPKGLEAMAERLRLNQEHLLEHRHELEAKDRQVQHHMESFVRDSLTREQVVRELEQARATHQRDMEMQREQLESEHRAALQRHHDVLEEENRRRLHDHVRYLEDQVVSESLAAARRYSESELRVGLQCEVLLPATLHEMEAEESAVIGELPAGSAVVLLATAASTGRLRVVNADGVEGWISTCTRTGLPVVAAAELEENPIMLDGSPALQRSQMGSPQVRMARWVAEEEEASRRLVGEAELQLERASEDLFAAEREARLLVEERDSEFDAAQLTRESYHAERRAAQRRDERTMAQVRSQVSETEALQDEHRRVEAKARALQQQLSKTVYTVGQRDQELKVKNGELQEVRQSVASIQDEMDEVNGRLKDQCNCLHRIEGSMRVSPDLEQKMRAMHAMLKESHSALGQLSSLWEAERARREQCTHGLRQQRVRTELLLQLLHHFKSRTQGLAPSALLGGGAGSAPAGAQAGGFT